MNHGLRAPGHNVELRPREPVPAQRNAEQTEVVRQESRSKSLAEFLQCITMVKEYRCNPVLRADPNLMERLFLNLTLNAVQAMKFSGELKIRVVESSKNVSISFIDKGCGMDKGVQEKIFGTFFTPKAGGTGLGLFLCKKYVDAHEGRIEVKTEPAIGSTFTVFLPRSPLTSSSRQSAILPTL